MNSSPVSLHRVASTLFICASMWFAMQLRNSANAQTEQNEAVWNMQRVRPSNSMLGKFPIRSKRAYDHIRLIQKSKVDSAERTALINSFFEDTEMAPQIGELLEYCAYAHVLYLESNPNSVTTKHYKNFGVTPKIGTVGHAHAYADVQEIERQLSIGGSSTLHFLCRQLQRTKDERAIPLLSRVYFFYGPFYKLGEDSWESEPGWIVHEHFQGLLYWGRRDLWEQFPKVKATMDSDAFLDSVRIWILDRKQSLLPSGVPVIANVQESAFRQFLANNKLPAIALTTEPTENSRSKSFTLILTILGGVVLFIIKAMWRTRGQNNGGK